MARVRTMFTRMTWAVGVASGLAACAGGAEPTGPAPENGRAAEDQEEGPSSYADVVEGLQPDSGLFVVHIDDEKLLFEIPDSLLGREMLVISRIARVPGDISGFIVAGHKVHEQVWTWERRGDRVLLRKQSYAEVAPDTAPISVSVVNNNYPPIVHAFDIEAENGDSSAVVIDVTELYAEDTPAISPLSPSRRRDLGVRRLDTDRSFVVFARSFPENVDVRHALTFEATDLPSSNNTGTLSVEMHQTMVALPTEPMRPRLADERVGYFSVSRTNFGLPAQKAESETFITRWRLEPSDPEAYARGEVVDPVEPIVYYIDPATPTAWRECVRQGVEDWQPAFETAGFSNAIIARDAPTPEEDPEWDMSDVRYSAVRWAASMVRNARGPSVADPRSGEIIESDIVWYHNHMRSYRNRLMIETGAANPLARDLPIDEGLMCEAMRQVIAHEIGHAIGLPHNMIASSGYEVQDLRDPAFADSMGVAPTIMDYARQNYIAQPGDGLEGDDFIRQVGPYDHYAVNWGYRVLPEAPTPEAEKETLNAWIVERADDPMYRYLPRSLGVWDPRAQTEDLGDDHVLASTLGIANLRRVIERLPDWATDPGEDYAELAELYDELVFQWYRYVSHVAAIPGGAYVDLKTADQPGAVYDAVPRAEQERALDFLAVEVFVAPTWLADPDVLDRIGENGFETISTWQGRVLGTLMDARRLARLAALEVTEPTDAYPLAEYLAELRSAVWGSLPSAAGDPYRRALHRAYLEEAETLLTEEPSSSPFLGGAPDISRSDIRPLLRSQLRRLADEAGSAAQRAATPVARAHLEDIADRIAEILDADD